MTVIAAVLTEAGGAIVASDSLVVKELGQTFTTPKLRRVKQGIAAAAGDDEAVQLFLDWQAHGGKLNERPFMRRLWTWEGILVTRDKIIDFGGRQPYPDEVKKPFHAIGVGSDAALAVMAYQTINLLPLDPCTAIAAVCEVHNECGPPIDFLTIRPRKQ